MVDGVSGLPGHDVACHVMEEPELDADAVIILDHQEEDVHVQALINILTTVMKNHVQVWLVMVHSRIIVFCIFFFYI